MRRPPDKGFLSTLPARGATSWRGALAPAGARDFYPRSPRGERLLWPRQRAVLPLFLSTLPARGATSQMPSTLHSTPSNFYPRSPRGERRSNGNSNARPLKFLSTLPARGATRPMLSLYVLSMNFYPRSPRGERRFSVRMDAEMFGISIHAPREGSDKFPWARKTPMLLFLSTLPARGATESNAITTAQMKFLSTLPARGATYAARHGLASARHFYPRSPRGERPRRWPWVRSP